LRWRPAVRSACGTGQKRDADGYSKCGSVHSDLSIPSRRAEVTSLYRPPM
jgi:hypothetical protein